MEENKIAPSYDTKRQTLGKIYPLHTPFTVIIDSSEVCNFRCTYCFRSDNNKENWGDYTIKKNLMEWEVFCAVIKQMKDFPEEVRQISLSNQGEPLYNRNLPKMVEYIKKEGIKSRVAIHTNASLLDEEYAKRLADSGIDKIVVSLQGLDAETYKSTCGVAIDFNKFLRSLQCLYENKNPKSRINIKIMDMAVKGQEEKFYDMFSPIADTVFIEKAVPIWKDTKEGMPKPKTVQNKYGTSFPYQECCPLIFNTIVVTPEGDVYPCTQILSKERLGNIKDTSLVNLWNGEARKDLLLRQLQLTPPESCNGCYIRQNSIFTKEDMIDEYREEILGRIKNSK